MNTLIKPCHPETTEILTNARAAWLADEITQEQYNDAVRACFTAEVEAEILGQYPETKEMEMK